MFKFICAECGYEFNGDIGEKCPNCNSIDVVIQVSFLRNNKAIKNISND